MTALVVYESMFGNTRKIAEEIAEGLTTYLDVDLRSVEDATDPRRYDLVVAGGPTHAFSMSRASTRADAVERGATGSPDMGLREWLAVAPPTERGPQVATFDTRVESVRHFPGSAAKKAARVLHGRGYDVIARESFWVLGTDGPLADGELRRARLWGDRLARIVVDRATHQTA